mgnify:CR=1 FL=1
MSTTQFPELLDLPTEKIVNAVGTPTFVVSDKWLQRQITEFLDFTRELIPELGVYYSVKTNDYPPLLREILRYVNGLEVVSEYELILALEKLNVNPSRIILNGPNKNKNEIKMAVDREIYMINIDSLQDARRIEECANRLKKHVRVGIRLNLACSSSWHKFGLVPNGQEFQEVLALLKNSTFLDLRGLHHHGGHFTDGSESICFLLTSMLQVWGDLLQKGFCPEIIDIGGGFLPYGGFSTEGKWIYQESVKNIFWEISEFLKINFPVPPKLVIEPGRALVEGAVAVISKVGNVKYDNNKTWAYLDIGTSYVGGQHGGKDRVIFVPFYKQLGEEVPEQEVAFCGPMCYATDILGVQKFFPFPKEDDITIIGNAGAYTMSLRWHGSQPYPAIVQVNSDSEIAIHSTRQSVDGIFSFYKVIDTPGNAHL